MDLECDHHSVNQTEESPGLSVGHCQQASSFSSTVISRGTSVIWVELLERATTYHAVLPLNSTQHQCKSWDRDEDDGNLDWEWHACAWEWVTILPRESLLG